MWAVFKVNIKELNLFKEDIIKKLNSDVTFYAPKVIFKIFHKNKEKKKEQYLLGDYIFCFNEKFEDEKIFNSIKFTKSLKYIAQGIKIYQKEIKDFIKKCKSYENSNGYVSLDFYDLKINRNYKFASGPFINQIFKVLSIQKLKIQILMGGAKVSLKKNRFLFNPQ
jgi:hypothetical protein